MGADGIKIALCVVGAFYAFAGYVATRAALTSNVIDQAIAAIALKKPSPRETARSYWLLAAATLVLAGGVTLLFLLDVSVWLFLASSAGQALYLAVLAPLYFDAEDPPDAQGRRRTINAFVIYLAATAFVVWALSAGKLASWQEVAWPWLALPVAAIGAHIGYVVWTLAASTGSKPAFGGFPAGADDAGGRDPSESVRVKVMADYHTHPLWALDDDLYGDFSPENLDLSPELVRDLNAWAEAFTSSYDPDDPVNSRWTEAEHNDHEAEGRKLAVRLARERPERTIFAMTSNVGVVEIRPDDE